MSRLDRLAQRLRYQASKFYIPEDRVHILQTRTLGFDLLVRANEDVGRAIHFARSFEPLETDFLRGVLHPDSVCLDVGANVGYFTMLMASIATRGCIHAFEPLPLNAALITASAALNGFRNIVLAAAAVGAEPGTVEFVEATDSAYSSIHDTGRKGVGRRFDVPVVTLDAHVEKHALGSIDVLKIDVEGAEGLVIEGAAALLADPARRPSIILIELFQPNLDGFGTTVAAIVGMLIANDYTASVLDRSGRQQAYDPATDRHYNLIFTANRGAVA